MQSYAYLGASLADQANQRRQQSQGMAQMYGQYAPRQRQYRLGRSQLDAQKYMNASGERDRFRNFSVNALAGLMR